MVTIQSTTISSRIMGNGTTTITRNGKCHQYNITTTMARMSKAVK